MAARTKAGPSSKRSAFAGPYPKTSTGKRNVPGAPDGLYNPASKIWAFTCAPMHVIIT